MGSEATCRARFGDEAGEGKALLETDALLFRGAFRLKIPLRDVTKAVAKDGELAVTFPGGVARFELGPAAAKWAEKIANPKSRVEKMGVKRGQKASVIGVDDATLVAELEAAGADVSTRLRKESDLVVAQVDAKADLAKAATWKASLAKTGALWIVHPKGRADLKDVDVMAAVKRVGLTDNKVVRFSDTHSALRFVVPLKDR